MQLGIRTLKKRVGVPGATVPGRVRESYLSGGPLQLVVAVEKDAIGDFGYPLSQIQWLLFSAVPAGNCNGSSFNYAGNNATDFNVDMTFHPEEIAQMLGDYENDRHTGMDMKAISEEIYKYTSGYPYLVSAICKIIDERLEADWDLDNVQRAVKIIAKGENVTLIDDLSKNIENNPELRGCVLTFDLSSLALLPLTLEP